MYKSFMLPELYFCKELGFEGINIGYIRVAFKEFLEREYVGFEFFTHFYSPFSAE